MSWNDPFFMAAGFRVRHKYKRRPGINTQTCVLCGCKRRKTTSGWQWLAGLPPKWMTVNPPCVEKVRP